MIIVMMSMMIVLVDTQTGGSHVVNSVNGDWIELGVLFNLRSGFALVRSSIFMVTDDDRQWLLCQWG